MTKLSDIFEVLYESDLMPVTDGEVIILPNVALSRVTDLKSKLGALESGIEPLGYNRYELILPDEIDMEVEEEVPEESEEKAEEVEDSAEDKSEEKDSEEKDEEEPKDEPEEKDSKEDEKMNKAVEEICDIITDWIGEPVNESEICPECGKDPCECEVCPYCGENPCVCEETEEDLSEVMDQMTECGSKPSFKKNELASYLESFAGPNEIYEAQEDEYVEDEAPEAEEKKEKPADQKTISDYLTSEAEDVIDITEPAERQGLIDLLVHNKEVLWGPTSAKIQSFRSELENLDPADLEKKADDIFPEWRKHVKKYIVEPAPVEEIPVEDEAPVEEIEESVEEAVEEAPVEEGISSETIRQILDNDIPCKFWNDGEEPVIGKLLCVWDREIHSAPYENEEHQRFEHIEPVIEEPAQEENPEAAEEFQPDVKPDEQVLTEEPTEETDETERVVRQGFEVFGDKSNKNYEKAVEIVTQWYNNEGGLDSDTNPEALKADIVELINAANDPEEIEIVGSVIGLDPDVLPDLVEDEQAEDAD